MGKPKKDLQFWESAQMNNRTYLHFYDWGMELAVARFDWQGLPDTIDERYLELCLYSKGSALFFKDKFLTEEETAKTSNGVIVVNQTDGESFRDTLVRNGSYLALPFTNQGMLDVYHVPIKRRPIADNGYIGDTYDQTNSVIIYGNYLRKPIMREVELYARWLYDIQCAIMVNAKAQKTPVAVICDEDERLSMLNLYKNYDGNAPYIFGSKKLDLSQIKAISTGAPYVADKLQELKLAIWNELLTYLGINNINVVKKERLISDEVMRNQGGIQASRFSPLGMRQKAAEEINKMFGLNVTVDYREDYKEYVEEATESVMSNMIPDDTSQKGGAFNE